MEGDRAPNLRQELLALTEEVVAATLEWDTAHPQRTFDEIESFVVAIRRQLGQRMAQALCEQQASARPVGGPICPGCGREMHYKGTATHQVGSLVGEVRYTRRYYHCDHCQSRGIFPPGCATRPGGTTVECGFGAAGSMVEREIHVW
jgi:hypothetical protein